MDTKSIKRQRWKYIITDWVMTSVAFFLFNIYRYEFLRVELMTNYSLEEFLLSFKMIWEQVAIPPCLMIIYWLSGYYNRPYERSRLKELTTTISSVVINTAILYLVMMIHYHLWDRMASYALMGVLFSLLFIFLYSGRLAITQRTINKLHRKKLQLRTIIIGNSSKARETALSLNRGKKITFRHILGFMDIDNEPQDSTPLPDGTRLYTDINEIAQMASRGEIDEFIIVPQYNDERTVMRILYALFPLGKAIKIAPDMLSMMTTSIRISDLRSVPLMDISRAQISDCTRNLKRTLDVVSSIFALILLSPVLAVIAIIIKSTSQGPVIYSQQRIGYQQKPFNIYKFRSMYIDAEKLGPALSSDNDPRVTPFGRIMRKYRLDELPQFFNVLRGDMSLVGPRPEREFYIRQIVSRVPYYTMVHQVRPGITSLGMVKFGYAQNIDEMVERSRFDLMYLANMSLSMDMKIIIYTINTVCGGKGV